MRYVLSCANAHTFVYADPDLRFPEAGSHIHHCPPKAEGGQLDPTNRCIHE